MTRPPYDVLPAALRDWVDATLGSPVTTCTSESGGFSPGVAARVSCADGRRAFVKAVSAEVNPRTPGMHRDEARITAVLPPELGAPALIGTYDDGTWVGLLFEQVDGRSPTVPWEGAELAAALRTLDRLAEVPAPPGLPTAFEVLGEEFTGWRQLAADPPDDLAPWQLAHLEELVALESAWPAAGVGDRLLHLDARGDNMLIRPDGEVVLVDWPWAAAGNPVLDVVGFIPSAMLDGLADPEAALLATSAGRAAERDEVTSLVVAFAGMMEWAWRRPPPPGLATVRTFQAAQARTTGQWLLARTGWA